MTMPSASALIGNRLASASRQTRATTLLPEPFTPTIIKSALGDVEALQRDSRAKLERLRACLDDYPEDHLELTVQVKAKLDESCREITAGDYATPQAG
jgi:hypothetical protein